MLLSMGMIKKYWVYILLVVLLLLLSYAYSNNRNSSVNKPLALSNITETDLVPSYFKVPSNEWQRAYMSVDQSNIDGSPNSYRYSILLPPDMRIETDKDGKTTYVSYKATDGYEYVIYPSDMAANNLVGPAMEDVDKTIIERLLFGGYLWDSTKITFKSNNILNWYLSTTSSNNERYSFEATISSKEREKYIDLVGNIISSFKLETIP